MTFHAPIYSDNQTKMPTKTTPDGTNRTKKSKIYRKKKKARKKEKEPHLNEELWRQ